MAEANFKSGTVWTGDNLTIMRGMNSACVDLIYLDPPFNSNRNYAAPIGSKAAGAAFKDAWTLDDVDVHEHGELAENNPAAHAVIAAARFSHGKSMMAYLIFMAVRLLEMHRLLKSTGSIYLHCNQFASHPLKLLLDAIFGQGNFINEIVWNYGTPSGGRKSGRKPVKTHDVLLVYAKHYGNHLYTPQFTPYNEKYLRWFHHKDEDGRLYRTCDRNGKIVRQYLDESPGIPLSTVWSDIMQLSSSAGWFPKTKGRKEATGYPTQKPLALLDRILKASSNKGDMVFDPFCGCATTLVAAGRLQRQWAGVDLSPLAVKLVNERLHEILGELGARWEGAIALDAPPRRSDLGKLPNYRTHKHFLYGKQEGICNGCEIHFPFRNLEVDHILPRSQGGTDHLDNLQLLCSACNRAKGGRSMAQWRATR
ncbi:MAG: HNH endonuclease [Rhodobacteraceae bacterium]|nr:HNH endonuclease [Paracoccaceae bacterium]